jgi:hypothetical protein
MSTAVVRRPPSRRELLALNVIGTAGFFVIWHLLAVSGWFPSRFLPSPLEVVRMIVQLAQSPYSGATLWGHLGASLARLEIRCMFEELLRRLPDIELDGEVQRLRSNFINGIKHMPVRFTPATAG